MKSGLAFILSVAALASGPLYADTTPPATGTVAAPGSATSSAARMVKAFGPMVGTCQAIAPGQLPVLTPATRNEPACILSPFQHSSWGICPPFPPSPVLALPPGSPPAGKQQAFIVGNQIEATQQGVSTISGDVQIDQGDHRVTGRSMSYDSNTGLATVKEGVNYYTPDLVIASPTGRYDTNKGLGSFDDADFLLPRRHGRGSSKLVNSFDSDHSELFDVQYTTCPVGNTDWLLKAPDMTLDTLTNTGVAHDVTIDFLGLPIFWTPYISFPISDDRKSGFLSGAFSFDTLNGLEIEAPYYLNLAPNYEATLYPRIISKRGIQLGASYALLTPVSYDYIYASYLPHDQVYDSEYQVTGDHGRGQLQLYHDMTINDTLRLTGDYNWVSDDYFFHDLNSDLPIASSTYLDRSLTLLYAKSVDLSVSALMQDFQVIDPGIARNQYPYRRIPDVNLSWVNLDDVSGPEYSLRTELVRFQREQELGGWRLDVRPSMSLPMGGAAGFFTPALGWRYTSYNLAEQERSLAPGSSLLVANPYLGDAHPTRSLPIFDIDTGLYFDRDAGDYIQTLEPRLFYLRVPFRDQSAIPVFDAQGAPFSALQLFSTNSFYGADRQSDANQLSYGLTTRFLDPDSGTEVLRADLGQIRYFSDRRVQLVYCTAPGTPVNCTPTQTSLFSDIVADVIYNLNDEWTLTHQQLWSPVTRRNDLGAVLLQYHPAYRQVVNLSYQYQSLNYQGSLIKQTDFSFSWPLTGNWNAVGRWNYDISSHPRVTLEDFIGFEYENCCWDFQILHRHMVVGDIYVGNNVAPQFDNVFFFQLSLKGLITAGRHLDDLVENGILGYSDPGSTQSQAVPPP